MPDALASSSLSPWWHDRRARQLFLIGIVLVASGLVHGVIWGLAGGPWEGPATWRKPILFGISGGLTSLSLAWAWAQLPRRTGDAWLAAATAWALLVEVVLIDMQAWRGVASHFNRSTPLDSFLYDAMGGLILFVTLVAIDLTVRFFIQRTALEPDMLLAARAGLMFLVWSCLLGIWVSVHGDIRMASGFAPETFGRAGVLKFPHGAVIHALQWLPLLAWAGRRAGLPPSRRFALVASATLGTALLGAFALVQTLAGRARFDTTSLTVALLAAGVVCLAVPACVTAWTWARGAGARRPSVQERQERR
ncbi:MAG: hypothetical protein KGR24_00930 [Planctomycetes bacterium]|nr:hypothetical protein [Planctomycetota bacterium]